MSGAVFDPAKARSRRALLPYADLQKELYASLYAHCQREIALCRGSVDQLGPRERARVIATYGEAEAWRWCATDDLQRLVGCLDEMMRRADLAASDLAKDITVPTQPELGLTGGKDAL